MKNSLGMVLSRLDEVADELPANANGSSKIPGIQQEAKRLNNNLIELLTLYKIENERISPIIDEINVQCFLQESIAENLSAANSSNMELTYDCPDDLFGYFDEVLLHSIINNLIGNAMRYSESRIELSALENDGYLVLCVEDDGAGFPEAMLKAQQAETSSKGITSGRTMLGIHFARLIAQMHQNNEKKGFIRLSNNGKLKGGCFSIYLP
ncbi:MAG: HAMP domain-containing histidine kinase [Gammaproteobacteria bacterium]|nr:HAMP domain-containing histidine kinase [Gammaproteobacteria bacterium]